MQTRFIVFCLLSILTGSVTAYAQHDSTRINGTDSLNSPGAQTFYKPAPDSATIAQANRERFLVDSFAMITLNPDSLRENKFLTQMLKNNLADFSSFPAQKKAKGFLRTGRPREAREKWIIAAIIGLLIYTALLNIFLSKDIKSVIQSFYDKHALSQADKEGGPINFWTFIGLFILFSLSFGLVLYQLTVYEQTSYRINGFRLFISLSVIVGMLFALKFLILKFIGFIFDINRLVSQYIAILNLTYFNIAFVLLSVAVCFSLLANELIPYLLACTLVLIAVIFAWQYVRNSVSIISNFRFHKFYLFVYLCALEICPILILIKALNR